MSQETQLVQTGHSQLACIKQAEENINTALFGAVFFLLL